MDIAQKKEARERFREPSKFRSLQIPKYLASVALKPQTVQNIWGSNDLTEKMKTYTEKNISAYAECVGKLGQAKKFQEVFRIQTEFMQTQLNSFAQQARSLGEAYNKAAMDATKPFRIPT